MARPRPTQYLKAWAENNGVTYSAALEIQRQANRIADLGVIECNKGSEVAEPAYSEALMKFGDFIKKHGFEGFTMPGLYPLLRKNGHDVSMEY